ncbi:MAG: arginine--tRNA ligase [Bacteroidetes bacterium CG23_combo_of_CG06-09_8_20_14_all_32_9]|nr:MAG: arginine--tRNA ligase [Bacteroidetes bacterium CG23_combo_of_CG06-09_8_20_14_all_32_9]
MTIESFLTDKFCKAIEKLYLQTIDINQIQIQKTKKDFTGDYTINVFPFLKISKKTPEQTASEIGNFLKNNLEEINSFEVIKGFLNLSFSDSFWINELNKTSEKTENTLTDSKNILIEYSSPNTNKPLHLGHIRNNLIGHSLSEILKATGNHVTKVNLINDRGIHICKSMLAWQKWGNGITPGKANIKGDKLVGDFYVLFDKEYKKQIAELLAKGKTQEQAENETVLILEVREMLRKWEAGDAEVRKLWITMNNWVYNGFEKTYKILGITFDKTHYESQTYELGKKEVYKGLEKNVLIKKDDNSICADLTDDGLDEKVLLRSDGTSVYITQDIGTAIMRKNEFYADKMIYVVGNEQNYHFQVLKLVLKKLGYDWHKNISHLSYGMVELPQGKMKSREGTVVDADDLIDEMFATAKSISDELGKLDGLSEVEKTEIVKMVGLGALKYFILKVDPKKNMLYNPVESIDFNGNTGPFIQYTHARIKSVLRKANEISLNVPEKVLENTEINETEKSIIKLIADFKNIISEAATELNPALIANYVYTLAKEYNQFYHDFSILKEENTDKRNFRLFLSSVTAKRIKDSMRLLGIDVPERM